MSNVKIPPSSDAATCAYVRPVDACHDSSAQVRFACNAVYMMQCSSVSAETARRVSEKESDRSENICELDDNRLRDSSLKCVNIQNAETSVRSARTGTGGSCASVTVAHTQEGGLRTIVVPKPPSYYTVRILGKS